MLILCKAVIKYQGFVQLTAYHSNKTFAMKIFAERKHSSCDSCSVWDLRLNWVKKTCSRLNNSVEISCKLIISDESILPSCILVLNIDHDDDSKNLILV